MKIPASKGLPSKPTAEYTMRGAIFKGKLGTQCEWRRRTDQIPSKAGGIFKATL